MSHFPRASLLSPHRTPARSSAPHSEERSNILEIHDLTDHGGTAGVAATAIHRPMWPRFSGRSAPTVLSRGIAALAAWMKAFAGRMCETHRRNIAIRQMHDLPDSLLRDIGLSRSDIHRAAHIGWRKNDRE